MASSIPATSSKVTRIVWGSTRRARERPKFPSAPAAPPPAARRASRTNSPTISSVGPNPSSSSASSDWPGLGDLALISTPFSWSSAESWLPFQKLGTWVLKSFVGDAFCSLGG